jgi:Cell division control protein 24, OB domain 2
MRIPIEALASNRVVSQNKVLEAKVLAIERKPHSSTFWLTLGDDNSNKHVIAMLHHQLYVSPSLTFSAPHCLYVSVPARPLTLLLSSSLLSPIPSMICCHDSASWSRPATTDKCQLRVLASGRHIRMTGIRTLPQRDDSTRLLPTRHVVPILQRTSMQDSIYAGMFRGSAVSLIWDIFHSAVGDKSSSKSEQRQRAAALLPSHFTQVTRAMHVKVFRIGNRKQIASSLHSSRQRITLKDAASSASLSLIWQLWDGEEDLASLFRKGDELLLSNMSVLIREALPRSTVRAKDITELEFVLQLRPDSMVHIYSHESVDSKQDSARSELSATVAVDRPSPSKKAAIATSVASSSSDAKTSAVPVMVISPGSQRSQSDPLNASKSSNGQSKATTSSLTRRSTSSGVRTASRSTFVDYEMRFERTRIHELQPLSLNVTVFGQITRMWAMVSRRDGNSADHKPRLSDSIALTVVDGAHSVSLFTYGEAAQQISSFREGQFVLVTGVRTGSRWSADGRTLQCVVGMTAETGQHQDDFDIFHVSGQRAVLMFRDLLTPMSLQQGVRCNDHIFAVQATIAQVVIPPHRALVHRVHNTCGHPVTRVRTDGKGDISEQSQAAKAAAMPYLCRLCNNKHLAEDQTCRAYSEECHIVLCDGSGQLEATVSSRIFEHILNIDAERVSLNQRDHLLRLQSLLGREFLFTIVGLTRPHSTRQPTSTEVMSLLEPKHEATLRSLDAESDVQCYSMCDEHEQHQSSPSPSTHTESASTSTFRIEQVAEVNAMSGMQQLLNRCSMAASMLAEPHQPNNNFENVDISLKRK